MISSSALFMIADIMGSPVKWLMGRFCMKWSRVNSSVMISVSYKAIYHDLFKERLNERETQTVMIRYLFDAETRVLMRMKQRYPMAIDWFPYHASL